MGVRSNLSAEKRTKIVGLSEVGFSQRRIYVEMHCNEVAKGDVIRRFGATPFWTASLFDTSPRQVHGFNGMQKLFRDCPFVNWTMNNRWSLSNVIFSDEVRVSIGKCGGRVFVGRETQERYCNNASRQSVMAWCFIGFWRLGHLVEVPVAMNQDDYVNIMSQHLLASAQERLSQTQTRYRISQSTT